jgi:pimeloyl-ACP methyl ester carboxylesterase
MRTLMSLFTILVMVFSQGCGFSKLKQDLKEWETVSTISGTIISESPRKKPIFIALFSIDKELLRYDIKYKFGQYEFFVLPGTYYIAAFEDANEDFIFQHDEYVGAYGSPDPIEVAAGSNIDTINVTLLSPEKAKLAMPQIYTKPEKAVKIEAKDVNFGKIVKINDPRFSIENAEVGLWEPFRFINEVGAGIFFMESYNPKKIPIIFVHGAGGHPGQWAYLIEHIDRTRFQPWLAFYPSGLRIGDIGNALADTIARMKQTYKFDNTIIVAHSMGGLVSRSAINHLSKMKYPGSIKLFVSISTPWGGHSAAAQGIKHAPAVVPAWYDMAPDSPFIASLYETPLPKGTDFYLIFSHKSRSGMSNLFKSGNNDGVVTLRSQLSLPAQKAAVKTYGLFEDHVLILNSKTTSDTLNDFLNKSLEK